MVAKQHSEDMDHFWWNLYWEVSAINYPIPNSSSYSNDAEFLSQYVWIFKGHDVTACLLQHRTTWKQDTPTQPQQPVKTAVRSRLTSCIIVG